MLIGLQDSSGIRFHVTKQLRKYDSGIMELGLEYTNKMAVPPGQVGFRLPGFCIPDCTSIVSWHHKIHSSLKETRDRFVLTIGVVSSFPLEGPAPLRDPGVRLPAPHPPDGEDCLH